MNPIRFNWHTFCSIVGMALIVNLFNRGKRSIKTGLVSVNSRNVWPSTILATPSPGTVISLAMLDSAERFNTAQTSAATDVIVVQAGAPVGTIVEMFASSAHRVQAASGETINGVTTTITVAANALIIMRKTSATAWVLTHYASNGALTAPTT